MLVWNSKYVHDRLTLTETIFGGINVDNCLLIANDMLADNLVSVGALPDLFFLEAALENSRH